MRALQQQEGGLYRSYGNNYRAQQVHLYTNSLSMHCRLIGVIASCNSLIAQRYQGDTSILRCWTATRQCTASAPYWKGQVWASLGCELLQLLFARPRGKLIHFLVCLSTSLCFDKGHHTGTNACRMQQRPSPLRRSGVEVC